MFRCRGRRRRTPAGPPGTADDFVQQPKLELAEAGAAELLVEEDRPQPLVFDLLLQAADVGLHAGIGRTDRVREHELERFDLFWQNSSTQSSFFWNSGSVEKSHATSKILPDAALRAHRLPPLSNSASMSKTLDNRGHY